VRVLVTGRGTGGSWTIRGQQLGEALGATIDPNANSVKGFDLAIVVKRPRADLLERLRHRGTPIVWDMVDFWPQPEGNNWERDVLMGWLRDEVNRVQPAALVAATKAMAKDCVEFNVPVLYLPHHARPDQLRNPIRKLVQAVGYEGGPQYVAKWGPVLEEQCRRRGWRFVINPSSLDTLDIVVAVRDQKGYAPRNWKSNVKLANAQSTGTPCVLAREQGYLEAACGAEEWADTVEELNDAFDKLLEQNTRQIVQRHLISAAPTIEGMATRYQAWLRQLSF